MPRGNRGSNLIIALPGRAGQAQTLPDPLAAIGWIRSSPPLKPGRSGRRWGRRSHAAGQPRGENFLDLIQRAPGHLQRLIQEWKDAEHREELVPIIQLR